MKKLLLVLFMLLIGCSMAIGATAVTLPFEMDFMKGTGVKPHESIFTKDWLISRSGWGKDKEGGIWSTYSGYAGKQGEVCEHSTITADVWLISPSLPLEAGKGYQITFTYKRYEGNTEKLNIGLAGTRTIEAMGAGTILHQNHEIINDDWETSTFTFRSDVGGLDCCIGFQCVSDPLPDNPSKKLISG